MTKDQLDQVRIYALGVVQCSVCSGLGPEETVEAANILHPTGVHPWVLDKAATFRTGEPNPCPCHDDPERKHYLLSC